MTAHEALRLRAEIGHELANLSRVVKDVSSRQDARDDTTTYALALLLMNYYTGVERIFTRVSSLLGGTPRPGDRWHAQLLEDMALDLPGVRPSVVRGATADALARYLRFRHVIRNLYAWTIRRDEMDGLVRGLPAVAADLDADLGRFGEFLDASGRA